MKKKLTIICDSDYSIEHEWSEFDSIDHRIIVFSDQQASSCVSRYHLDALWSQAQVTILWIIHNQNKISIDGQILIWPSGKNTVWQLSEEVLIIGDHSYSFTKPVLDVAHNIVSASHKAKIHRIPKNELFYLHSRGLSQIDAKKIIIWWRIETMFDDISDIEIIHHTSKTSKQISEKEEIIKRIYHSIFS